MGFPFSLFVWEDMNYIKQQYSPLLGITFQHYGDVYSRTGEDTVGGHGGTQQFGIWSSIQRFTRQSAWLLQVCGCFGSNDGIDHFGSGVRLCTLLSFHPNAIMQPGKKHLIALIERIYLSFTFSSLKNHLYEYLPVCLQDAKICDKGKLIKSCHLKSKQHEYFNCFPQSFSDIDFSIY